MSDEVKKYFQRFEREVLPHMRDSTFTIAIAPRGEIDAKMCLEIGAAVLLDKPIIVAVSDGAAVSANLKRVATEIVEGSRIANADFQQKLQDAISRVLENDARVKGKTR
jgi:hypothetical protein